MILELLLAHAPDSTQLQEQAQEYGADKERFEKESLFCILCGLGVNYCAGGKKKNARTPPTELGFAGPETIP